MSSAKKVSAEQGSNRYEAVIIFDSDLSDDGVKAELSKVENLVKAHAGSVERSDLWGRRRLAYKIRKKEYGIYVVLVIAGDNTLVSDLDRQLKINEQVLRHLVVIKDQYAPDFSSRLEEQPDNIRVQFGEGDEMAPPDEFVAR
jgi:small subunit ribosomal protein S6